MSESQAQETATVNIEIKEVHFTVQEVSKVELNLLPVEAADQATGENTHIELSKELKVSHSEEAAAVVLSATERGQEDSVEPQGDNIPTKTSEELEAKSGPTGVENGGEKDMGQLLSIFTFRDESRDLPVPRLYKRFEDGAFDGDYTSTTEEEERQAALKKDREKGKGRAEEVRRGLLEKNETSDTEQQSAESERDDHTRMARGYEHDTDMIKNSRKNPKSESDHPKRDVKSGEIHEITQAKLKGDSGIQINGDGIGDTITINVSSPDDTSTSRRKNLKARNSDTTGTFLRVAKSDEDVLSSSNASRLLRRNTYAGTGSDKDPETKEEDAAEQIDKSDGFDVQAETSSRKKSPRKKKEEEVNFGNKVDEKHASYILMYDMLTGIRVAVSRYSAKPHRELALSDFRAAHKLVFDVTGNELTPSSKYDFKFKDYAPWVFRQLREFFGLDASDYLVSLTGKYVLSELGSPGKSGSFFYYSQDYRFIIKTISHTEHSFLLKILKDYYEHIRKNPNTLISRFYGLHRVKLPGGRKIPFVVMGNIFPPNKDIHEVYDLKGSLIGREVSEEKIQKNPRSVMKDVNWLKRDRKLVLGPEKRRLFLEQIQKDSKFLSEHNIMDYSLLLGIHYRSRGNSEGIRDKQLSVFEPNTDGLQQMSQSSRKAKAKDLKKAIKNSEPQAFGPSSAKFPEETPFERRKCIFYQDDGGFAATDGDNCATNELYYLGVIDILTPYNVIKKVEHYWKSLSYDRHLISAVHPHEYSLRFIDFLVQGTTGGTDVIPSRKEFERGEVHVATTDAEQRRIEKRIHKLMDSN